MGTFLSAYCQAITPNRIRQYRRILLHVLTDRRHYEITFRLSVLAVRPSMQSLRGRYVFKMFHSLIKQHLPGHIVESNRLHSSRI
jgi:hypothetical protein